MQSSQKIWTLSLISFVAVASFLAFVSFFSSTPQHLPSPANIEEDPEAKDSNRIRSLAGIYTSNTLPSASSPERLLILTLREDLSATLSTDFQNEKSPLVETGEWYTANNTALTVTLSKRNGIPLSEEQDMVFSITPKMLTLTEYDPDVWGSSGLVLFKQEDTPKESENPLKETSWQWVRTTMSNDAVFTPHKKDAFILTFLDDTRFGSTTDCNRLMGSYAKNGDMLTFSQTVSTKMACASDTQEEIYAKGLGEVSSYSMQNNTLLLNLSLDSGIMEFIPASETTTSSVQPETSVPATLVP